MTAVRKACKAHRLSLEEIQVSTLYMLEAEDFLCHELQMIYAVREGCVPWG